MFFQVLFFGSSGYFPCVLPLPTWSRGEARALLTEGFRIVLRFSLNVPPDSSFWSRMGGVFFLFYGGRSGFDVFCLLKASQIKSPGSPCSVDESSMQSSDALLIFIYSSGSVGSDLGRCRRFAIHSRSSPRITGSEGVSSRWCPGAPLAVSWFHGG